jgi:serine/threonine-protein kinase
VSATRKQHPSEAQLIDFANGHLQEAEFSEVADHLQSCGECLEWVSGQAEDTLAALAREAATLGFEVSKPAPKGKESEIPSGLRHHPRYRLIEQIGSGGMGTVYKAEHRIMRRLVALKIIQPRLLANAQAVERFRREVRVSARLVHPNIVVAHDADQVEDRHFLIMEFVDGESLDKRIAREGPLAARTACEWIRQAALGLQCAHEQGMVHRDIKPHNLMITRDGQLKILDFGLSRFVSEQAPALSDGNPIHQSVSATRTDMILGTPDYVAPEQIERASDADIRSDIYSLGCTLFYLLTGTAPFAALPVVAKFQAHHAAPFPRLDALRPDVSRELLVILDRMTAKQPFDRYSTPAELVADLDRLLSQSSNVGSRGVGSVEIRTPGPRFVKQTVDRRPWIVGAALVTFAVLCVLIIAYQIGSGRRGTPIAEHDVPRQESPDDDSGFTPPTVPSKDISFRKADPEANQKRGDFQGELGGTSVAAKSSVSPAAFPEVTGVSPLKRQADAKAPGARRVLVMLPSVRLWYPDYEELVLAAPAQNIQLTFASISNGPSQLLSSSPNGTAVPDMQLGPAVRAADFDAIMFIGYDAPEFFPQGVAGNETRRLLNEFQSQRKIVSSLCTGQLYLARHGQLRGKTVAKCETVEDQRIRGEGGNIANRAVVVDGHIITASHPTNAAELLVAIREHKAN